MGNRFQSLPQNPKQGWSPLTGRCMFKNKMQSRTSVGVVQFIQRHSSAFGKVVQQKGRYKCVVCINATKRKVSNFGHFRGFYTLKVKTEKQPQQVFSAQGNVKYIISLTQKSFYIPTNQGSRENSLYRGRVQCTWPTRITSLNETEPDSTETTLHFK